MKSLEYNNSLDLIKGFEDLGQLGRSSKPGTHALVIMLTGIYQNWKLPLAYYITNNGASWVELKKIMEECEHAIVTFGFKPKAMVCNQSLHNGKFFETLGCTPDDTKVEI